MKKRKNTAAFTLSLALLLALIIPPTPAAAYPDYCGPGQHQGPIITRNISSGIYHGEWGDTGGYCLSATAMNYECVAPDCNTIAEETMSVPFFCRKC